MKKLILSLICLFVSNVSFAQFYEERSEEEIWEDEHNSTNNYDEILTKHGYVYDESEGKALAESKRVLLHNALSFYDKQLNFVNQWIQKGKCKVSKVKKNVTNDETIESILFLKSLFLDSYEKNLPEEVSSILSNKVLCSEYKEKLKADKSYMSVILSLRERLSKEKQEIESVINKDDSLVLLYNSTKKDCIGLLYITTNNIDFYEFGYTRIAYNWIPELEKEELNTLPQKWGEIQYKNPNYNPAEGEWCWLHSDDYKVVRTSYPTEETYKKFSSHPEYKVKEVKDRVVVYLNDNVVYIEKGKDNNSELIRQVCIYDYKNNKYDIKKSSVSQLTKIDEMLIEGKDRMYYVGSEMAYRMAKQAYEKMLRMKNDNSLGGLFTNAMVNVPSPSEQEKAKFEEKLSILENNIEKAKLLDTDPEYRIAEKYIKQLTSDREDLTFKHKRIDGLSYLYISSDGMFKIKMEMSVEGKTINDSYKLIE